MANTMRDALAEAGIPIPDRSIERDLHDEIARLTKIVREQAKEKRRLTSAYSKLKDEKRSTHEMIAMCEQLQEEIEALEDSVAFYESDRITQSLRDAKRSKQALSVRHGILHGALRTLLADPSAREQAAEALAKVEDGKAIRALLPSLDAGTEE